MLGKWVPLWVVPLLILFSIGTVWLRLTIVRTTYEIGQMSRQIEQTRKERENLQLKAAGLKSPRKLEALARAKFKLAQPRGEQIVQLKRPEMLDNGL